METPAGRLSSLRGFTIAAMVLVNNPGDWNNLYSQLAHAKWQGWTFTDTVFPFFHAFLLFPDNGLGFANIQRLLLGAVNTSVLYALLFNAMFALPGAWGANDGLSKYKNWER